MLKIASLFKKSPPKKETPSPTKFSSCNSKKNLATVKTYSPQMRDTNLKNVNKNNIKTSTNINKEWNPKICSDLRLKPSDLSNSEDSISSGVKSIRFEKCDSKIFCRCCDANLKSDKKDTFRRKKVYDKCDIKLIEEKKKVDKIKCGKESERSFITRNQNHSKNIKPPRNHPTIQRLSKQCSQSKEGLDFTGNPMLPTLVSKKASIPKCFPAFRKRILIQEACAAKKHLQEECRKNPLLQQSLQKTRESLCKSKLGMAIARRRGLNYLNKEDEVKCPCCSCNKKRERKFNSLTENLKREKCNDQQISLEQCLGKPRIKCNYCGKLWKDNFCSEKSRMEIRCCCCEQRFENTRQIDVGKGELIQYEKCPNVQKFVCHFHGSPKICYNNQRQEKKENIMRENRREKYCQNSKQFCISSHQANEKPVLRNLIKKCSYHYLPTNVCNCEDPLEIVDFKKKSHLLKKSCKSKPCGSEILPYQSLSVFSDVMSELQQKICGSVCCHICKQEHCCCGLRENSGENGKIKAGENHRRKTIIW